MKRGLDLKPSDYFSRRRESYFFDYVKDELIKEYGAQTVKLGGLVVHTTIDLDKQRKAREAIATQLGDAGPSSALVTINPRNGYILAMASSGDYADSKFNLAAQGERQPGSSFKTMALMTALRNGVNPNSTRYTSVSPTRIDDPRYGAPFEIKTYGGTSGGNMNLFQATLRSDNSVFIQLALDLGPENVADTAVDMGIKREHVQGYPAESLGGLEEGVSPLEMATAYATIASGGYRNRPTAITKVEFPDGASPSCRAAGASSGPRSSPTARPTRRPRSSRPTSRAAPARAPPPAARRPARPAPPTATPTPGSRASRRASRPPSGSAIPTTAPRCTRCSSAGRSTAARSRPPSGAPTRSRSWAASAAPSRCRRSRSSRSRSSATTPAPAATSSGFSEEPDEPGEPTSPRRTRRSSRQEDGAPSGGTEFDPEQYESAPQDPPDTETPPAEGTPLPRTPAATGINRPHSSAGGAGRRWQPGS